MPGIVCNGHWLSLAFCTSLNFVWYKLSGGGVGGGGGERMHHTLSFVHL